ncbi:putative Ig domain-containing protein, partial [Dyadobacter sediminis]
MKEDFFFTDKLARFYARVWPLILLIGLIVSVQSYALNFVRDLDFLSRPFKHFVDSQLAAARSSEKLNSEHGLTRNQVRSRGIHARLLAVADPAPEFKVNFQEAATVTPDGWLKDYGQPFGPRTGTSQGSGLEYGWRKVADGTPVDLSVGGTSNLGNGRKRTKPADNILLATLMHMQANTIPSTTSFNGTRVEGYWEMKVPNGTYDVTVSAGDGDVGTVPESHTLNVEGVNAFSNFIPSGVAGASTRFKSTKVRATVNDGFLTINATGGTNTKINTAIITPVPVNNAPVAAAAVSNQTAKADSAFSFTVPAGTFTDADGDKLTLSATLSDGTSLPEWLTFNPTSNTLAGMPVTAGTYSIRLTATDGQASASSEFTLTVNAASTPTNATPVAAAIGNQTAKLDSAFSFAVPAGTFTDADGDVLTISASLSDGTALPQWLTFDQANNTFSGTPAAEASYSIRLAATDGKASAATEFQLNVISGTTAPVNTAPVASAAIGDQSATTGTAFSLTVPAGTFTDKEGDKLTLSAALSGGAALPQWLSFDNTSNTFSGTPETAAAYRIILTATDGNLSASTEFNLTVTAAVPPIVVACPPISTLPCDKIAVALPFTLNFDGTEGGLADQNKNGTGFTMVDAYSGARQATDNEATFSNILGYEPSRLTVANGILSILTNKGIAHLTNNNQINALGAGITASGKITLETTLINPYNGVNSEQAGIWLGLNDKTYVKLVAVGNKIELRRELNDVSADVSDRKITAAISGLNTKTVRLRMIVDLINNKLEGFYSTNGTTYVNVGGTSTAAGLNIADLALSGKTAYAGIFATHRNGTEPVTFNFDNFSVSKEEPAVNQAPVFANASYSFTHGEDIAVGTGIGQVSATDAAGQTVSYSITAGNQASRFAIDPQSGAITLAAALNYATDSVYVLTVQAMDNATPALATMAQVTVKVNKFTPANQAPAFASASYSFTHGEDIAVGTGIGQVSATDAAEQTVRYSITAGNQASRFTIDSVSGAITLAAALNYATDSVYVLTVQAIDNATPALAATAQVTVHINKLVPANHAPVAALPLSDQVAVTGTAFTYNVAAGSFTDEDS